MAPDHKRISREINQDFDDLSVRNPSKYRELEQDYKRLKEKTGLAVAMAPTHIRQAERMT